MASATVAQAQFDEEIMKHMVAVRTLRTQRNTFSLIGRLCTETLTNIFIYYASDYYSKHNGCATSKPPPWVNVSYVCHHWRDAALNCPKLWIYLFITSQCWTEVLLARSKPALLKVHVASPSTNSQELSFMVQIIKHVERIQEVHLDLVTHRVMNEFFRPLSLRAPCLRSLTIETLLVSNISESSSVLFDGDTPALHTLELRGCPIPWYLFRLSGLTTLSLKNVPHRVQKSVGEFLATLCGMQNLAHLYLDRAFSGAADFRPNLQRINLPHLSRLLIVDPLSTVIALLSRMEFPLETELRLEWTESLPDDPSDNSSTSESDPSSIDEYAILLALLGQRLTSCTAIRSLAVDKPTPIRTRLMFNGSKRDYNSFRSISEDRGLNTSLWVIIYFDQSMAMDDRVCITGNVCHFLPLTHVQYFHIIGPPTLYDFWSKTTRQVLADLRNIKLSNGGMPKLVSVLSASNLTASNDTESRNGNADRGSRPVSALEELELDEIFFSGVSEGFKSWHATDTQSQSLYDTLFKRKSIQGQLIMARCCLGNDWGRWFDFAGKCEGGHFRHIVEKRDYGRS